MLPHLLAQQYLGMVSMIFLLGLHPDDIHWSVDARTGDRFIMGTDVELQEVYND